MTPRNSWTLTPRCATCDLPLLQSGECAYCADTTTRGAAPLALTPVAGGGPASPGAFSRSAPLLPLLDERGERFRDELVRRGVEIVAAIDMVVRFPEDPGGWHSFARLIEGTRLQPLELFRLLQEHGYLPRTRVRP